MPDAVTQEATEKMAFMGFYTEPGEKAQLQATAELEAMSMSELLALLVRAYNRTGKLPDATK